jgi:hypothetical protein
MGINCCLFFLLVVGWFWVCPTLPPTHPYQDHLMAIRRPDFLQCALIRCRVHATRAPHNSVGGPLCIDRLAQFVSTPSCRSCARWSFLRCA